MSPRGSWLDAAIVRHRVPGASLALWRKGAAEQYCAGYAALTPARPVTPTTRFRYGSVTKLFTATTALGHVDRGRLTLETPIATILPAFRTADPARSARVTVRHLLQHSGGFFGDLYESLPPGRDVWARYVECLGRLPHPFEPGDVPSYSNAGYVLLAHLTEVLASRPWDEAVTDAVLRPLGLESVELVPDWPPAAAEGHRLEGEGAEPWIEAAPLPALAPAGSMAIGTASDLLAFARCLGRDGAYGAGAPLLSRALARAQRELSVESPSPSFAMAWGLGVMQFDREARLFGHDGAVPGQNAFLRYVPDADEALVLLTNGGDGRALCQELLEELRREDPSFPTAPRFDAIAGAVPALDAAVYVGEYRNARYRIRIAAAIGALQLRFEPGADAGDLTEVLECRLAPMTAGPRPELFVTTTPGSTLNTTQRFSRFAGGRARLLHFRGRVFERID